MPYAAILFDLFDTLVTFDRGRLPLLTVGEKSVRSTAGILHAELVRHVPGVSLQACYSALTESWEEAERRRGIDHREVPAPERFDHFLRCLGLDPRACPEHLVSRLIDAHRRELGRAAQFPAHHGRLLQELAARVRLAVVSNFDYAPTALDILTAAGVADLFAAIVVSDQVGWRKPRVEIFARALAQLAVPPSRALFVGDRADIDVAGAHGAGMHAAWLNPAAEPLPRGMRPPEYEIRDLSELRPIFVPAP